MKTNLLSTAWLLLAVLVAGCGGGGDDATTRVTVDSTSISVSATPTDPAPYRTLTLSVSQPPAAGLYHGEDFSTRGLESVNLLPTSNASAQLQLAFKPAAALADGVYIDTVLIAVCSDNRCAHHVAGSPMTVTTRYTVSGGSANSVTIDRSAISVTASTGGPAFLNESLLLTRVGATPALPLAVQVSATGTAVATLSTVAVSDTQTRVDVGLVQPAQKPAGTYNDTVTIRVCYDSGCLRDVVGSPISVPISYTVVVGAVPEPGITPLTVSSRLALPHNVVDAKFSNALNAIVMVSSWPQNALYVYSAASGTEKVVGLAKVPTAVSVSPDGTHAAVGHDALVSHVDLTTAGDVGAAAPTRLNVSAIVGDLVLDGRGRVFVYPASDQWVYVHSIDIATNTETLQWGPTYAGTRVALHPSGNNIYGANNGLSPDDIENYDISSGQAVRLRDSPYHGDYPMCGKLWISDSGATVFTACGKTFSASTVAAQDMVYSGSMTLSSALYGFRIQSLSESTATREIALIENARYECDLVPTATSCLSHLNLYDSDLLGQSARYSITPLNIAGTSYVQRGLFVFHRNGGGKLLLSRLDGVTDPTAEYYLSVLP